MNVSKRPRIKLIAIDDDPAALELIREALSQEGVEILTATAAGDGLELVSQHHPEIVLLDLLMPGTEGMELLEKIVKACPTTDVILVTGKYSTDSAVEAIHKGASDYITKPVSIEDLRKRVGVLIEEAGRRTRALELDDEFLKTFRFEGMVGRSPLMLEMYKTIRRVAPHFRSVLVTGQTGTGKELVASALHSLSPVASRRMVTCNCTTIVESLFESELFGHVRGSFTGATQDKAGMVEYASGGTLFLDEIGDMPLEAQAKLLRVVESGEYHRVGSPAVRHADVRIVAATNRNLRELMDEHACMLTDAQMIDVRDLPETLKAQPDPELQQDGNLDSLSEVSRKHIDRVLERVEGNKARAAKILGINRATLYRYLK